MKKVLPLVLAAMAALCWLPSPASAEALRFYDPGTNQVLLVNSTNPLPVTGTFTGGGGTQYATGVTNAGPTGNVILGKSAANTLVALLVDSLGIAQVGSVQLPSSLGTKTAANSLSVTPASDATFVPGAGENHVGQVGGTTLPSSVTFTRPADTTAYAAYDAISGSTSAPALLTFANLLRTSGGSGYITKAMMTTTNTSWTGRVRLMLYTTNAVTPVNDNAQFPSLTANDAILIGWIDFPPPEPFGTGSDEVVALVPDARLAVVGSGSTSIFGIPVSRDAQTPTSAESFTFRLTLDSN